MPRAPHLEEVRAAQFGIAEDEPDAEMVAIAKAIIAQRTGSFDPSAYRDRYQEALRELIEGAAWQVVALEKSRQNGAASFSSTMPPRAGGLGAHDGAGSFATGGQNLDR